MHLRNMCASLRPYIGRAGLALHVRDRSGFQRDLVSDLSFFSSYHRKGSFFPVIPGGAQRDARPLPVRDGTCPLQDR
jgi:hypothetical protein